MLAADANVVQKIVDISQVQEFVLDKLLSKDGVEHHFTSKALHEVIPTAPPVFGKVQVKTLQGFADVIGQGIDGLDKSKWFIQVDGPSCVSLNSKATDSWGRRVVLLVAAPVEFKQFEFGQWLSQEEFLIGVAAKFSSTDDREYVIDVASSLTSDATNTTEDNGLSQRVNIKAGMKPKETVTLKPRVDLAPFRYFPECGQVVSPFVFRARQTENGPMLALFEADGGRWKVDAIGEVARFLRVLNTGIEVVA
jgi:hypothetical protein